MVTCGHPWHGVMGMLPGLCFKDTDVEDTDVVWISFKVGKKLMIKQNVAKSILN